MSLRNSLSSSVTATTLEQVRRATNRQHNNTCAATAAPIREPLPVSPRDQRLLDRSHVDLTQQHPSCSRREAECRLHIDVLGQASDGECKSKKILAVVHLETDIRIRAVSAMRPSSQRPQKKSSEHRCGTPPGDHGKQCPTDQVGELNASMTPRNRDQQRRDVPTNWGAGVFPISLQPVPTAVAVGSPSQLSPIRTWHNTVLYGSAAACNSKMPPSTIKRDALRRTTLREEVEQRGWTYHGVPRRWTQVSVYGVRETSLRKASNETLVITTVLGSLVSAPLMFGWAYLVVGQRPGARRQ